MWPEHFTPKLFTLLRRGYGLADLKSDFLAGMTVAIIALPLAMALGIASGASPEKGLITAIVAGFLISFLGGSHVQVGGPTGAFIVVVFDVILRHGYDGLILATIMAGFILILAGYAKLGQVIKYIPFPVVTGFTAGIAVIIATSQIKDFLGLDIPDLPAEFLAKWGAYLSHLHLVSPQTILVGFAALFLILLFKRFAPRLPAYLIVICILSLVVFILKMPVETIGSRFPDMPSGLPLPSLPVWDMAKIRDVIPAAFTIAFLAGIEALLSAVVADGMTGHRHRSNQELVGQGVANIASAFFGGLPATGAIARTATNIKSGARTPVSGIFHAAFILIFLLFAVDIIHYVPLAVLSAILFIVAWNMSETHHFIHIFRLSKQDRIVMVLTFILTVLVDLTVAIGVGVTLASLIFMHQMSQSVSMRVQGRRLRDISGEDQNDETQREQLPEGVEVFRFNGPIFFGIASTMIDTLYAISEMPHILILRMKLVPHIDVAGLRALRELISFCHKENAIVILSGLQPHPKAMLVRDHITDNGHNLFICDSYDHAIRFATELSQVRQAEEAT